jgi:hypothetical protein
MTGSKTATLIFPIGDSGLMFVAMCMGAAFAALVQQGLQKPGGVRGGTGDYCRAG